MFRGGATLANGLGQSGKSFFAGGEANAGGALGSLSKTAATASRTGEITGLAETPRSILTPGGTIIGSLGSTAKIRELSGGMSEANSMFSRLISAGAREVPNSNYPGTWYEFNSGGGFGFRTQMSRSPNSVATIDVNVPNVFKGKLKF